MNETLEGLLMSEWVNQSLPRGKERMASNRMHMPRRWRLRLPDGAAHPNGGESRYLHGCYFPLTDLCVGEMCSPGTGVPKGVEWYDDLKDLSWAPADYKMVEETQETP